MDINHYSLLPTLPYFPSTIEYHLSLRSTSSLESTTSPPQSPHDPRNLEGIAPSTGSSRPICRCIQSIWCRPICKLSQITFIVLHRSWFKPRCWVIYTVTTLPAPNLPARPPVASSSPSSSLHHTPLGQFACRDLYSVGTVRSTYL
jgi:hypothetical protein